MKKILILTTLMIFVSACASSINELPSFSERNKTTRSSALIDSDYVLKKLGEPTLKRREDPSEIWVYTHDKCVLFIYMNDVGTDSSRIMHMAIGHPSQDMKEKESRPCLKKASRLL